MFSSKKKSNMSKNGITKFIWAGVAVLVIALIAVAYAWMYSGSYWAVYLRTGDMYFGKMSVFPKMALTDVHILQLTGDENNPISISRFDRSIWGPEDKIYLDDDSITWKARLSDESQLLSYFKNPQQFQQPANGQQQPAAGDQQQLPAGDGADTVPADGE